MNQNPNLDFYGFPSQNNGNEAPTPNPSDDQPSSEYGDLPPEAYENTRIQVKKTFSRLGWGIFGLLAAWLLVSNVASYLLSKLAPQLSSNPWVSLALGTLPLYLFGIPLCYLIIRKQTTVLPEKKSQSGVNFVVLFFICVGLAIVGNLIGNALMLTLSSLSGYSYTNSLQSAMSAPLPATLLFTVVLAPILEELLCRKLILERALPYGEGVAILVSSLFFGLIHGNLYQFFYAFFLGALFAFVYIRTGKLRYSIALHMMINFFCGVLPSELLKSIDLEQLAALSDESEILGFLVENLVPYLSLIFHSFLLYSAAVVGIVLLIVFRKKFKLQSAPTTLPKPVRSAVFANVGMIVALAACGALMVCSLLIV